MLQGEVVRTRSPCFKNLVTMGGSSSLASGLRGCCFLYEGSMGSLGSITMGVVDIALQGIL